jgi:hypothetical protein
MDRLVNSATPHVELHYSQIYQNSTLDYLKAKQRVTTHTTNMGKEKKVLVVVVMGNAKEKTLIPLVTLFSLKKLIFIKKLSLM